MCVCTTEHYGLHIVCTKEQALWSTHCLHHTDTAPAEHEQSGPRPNVFPARAELTRPKVFPAREERNRHNVFPARAERRARCRCSVQRVGPGQAGPVEWRATRLLHARSAGLRRAGGGHVPQRGDKIDSHTPRCHDFWSLSQNELADSSQ